MPNSNNIKDALIKNNTMIANELNKTFAKRSDVNELASNKVDKVSGKGLSTNDYTTDEKNKLAGIESGAQKNPTTLSQLSDDSTHRLVTDAEKTTWNGKQNILTFDATPTALSDNPVTSSGIKTYVDNGIDDVWMHKSRSVGISCATITGHNNNIFNSIDTSVSKTFGYYDEYCGIQDLYGDNVDFRDLRIGDTVLITETNVPDRWLASVEYSSDYSTITYTFKAINTTGDGIDAQAWDSNEEVERDIIDFGTNNFEIKLYNHVGNEDSHKLIMNSGNSDGSITLVSDFGTDASHNKLQIERNKVTLDYYKNNESTIHEAYIKEGYYSTDDTSKFGMQLSAHTNKTSNTSSTITLNPDNIDINSDGDIDIGTDYGQTRLVGYGSDYSSILTLGNGSAMLSVTDSVNTSNTSILKVSKTDGLQFSSDNGTTWGSITPVARYTLALGANNVQPFFATITAEAGLEGEYTHVDAAWYTFILNYAKYVPWHYVNDNSENNHKTYIIKISETLPQFITFYDMSGVEFASGLPVQWGHLTVTKTN